QRIGKVLDNRLEARDVRQDAAGDYAQHDHGDACGHLQMRRQPLAAQVRDDRDGDGDDDRRDLARTHREATIVTSAPGISRAAASAAARSAKTPNTVGPEPLT